MTEPRRLKRSGGISQRLLDSASLDEPSDRSRRHATNLAATASSFASTRGVANGPRLRAHPGKTLATWIAVGAAASVTLGWIATKLFDASSDPRVAAPTLPAPTPRAATASSPDISPEPARPRLAPTPAPGPADEANELESARAALRHGDATSALAQLDALDREHPNGPFEPASMALRIQALTQSGQVNEARALAEKLRAKYPEHR